MRKIINLITLSVCLTSASPVLGACIHNNPIHAVVNKANGLGSTYVPKELVVPNIAFAFSGYHEKKQLEKSAAVAIEELFQAAEKQNLKLYAISGYRSYDRQKQIYESNVRKQGVIAANQVSAKPGHSEHQTGLAMDISCKSVGFELTQKFGDTPEGKWVADNAHKYGFILSYPKGKEHITGYIYEPWHIRFVGKELATYLYENNMVIEEVDNCDYPGIESAIKGHQEHISLAFHRPEQSMEINGVKMEFTSSTPAVSLNSVTYVPLRSVANTYQSNLYWDGNNKEITFNSSIGSSILRVGSSELNKPNSNDSLTRNIVLVNENAYISIHDISKIVN